MVNSNSSIWTITMVTIGCVLSVAIGIALVVSSNGDAAARSFEIDYARNIFVMDGKPFRYVAGTFHYFRALPQTWAKKLRTMRAAGINTLDTYIEWSLHNPQDGIYDFSGIADVEKFIRMAHDEGFYVILRPGPFICGERDNGGLPYWLVTKYPDIKIRTNDSDYTSEVSKWYAKVMTKMQPLMYGNGGPIIMVQVENEYSSFPICDKDYLNWLRDETELYVQKKAVLFTTDIPNENQACGKIEGVLATIDFGADRIWELDNLWKKYRAVQPDGPLVNSEYYPGWLTHWQESNQRRDPDLIADSLRKILETGANVNLYMFYGGTNFGFTAGANIESYGGYVSDVTSYDYDAVMDEAGDPTIKYIKIRNVINDFFPLPNLTVPEKEPKMSLEPVTLKPVGLLISDQNKQIVCTTVAESPLPKSFEELNQYSGLMLYEVQIPDELKIDPSLLTIHDLHDRAQIYVNDNYIGTLSRGNAIYSLPINAGIGRNIKILVENQGRLNYNSTKDAKGILGAVTIQGVNGKIDELKNWTSRSIPLEYKQIKKLVDIQKYEKVENNYTNGLLIQGPLLYSGEIIISNETIYDTYFDPSGWGKGVLFINGFNLGRYWPVAGPQQTLYVPKELLKTGKNEIVLLELQKAPANNVIKFTSVPNLDG